MSKKLTQFRFYSDESSENYPVKNLNDKSVTTQDYVSGSIFKDALPILQLGIQALPGTKFYLNGSINPIYVGNSGIYDLDIEEEVRINGLAFEQDSMNRINDTGSAILIVDILYGEEEA